MPIQYIKYNLVRFFLLRRDVQSRCFSVIVYTRNRHQPRDAFIAGVSFLIYFLVILCHIKKTSERFYF